MSSNPVTPNSPHRWLTVKLLTQAEPSFTEAALRYLIFNAKPRLTSRGLIPGNGLEPHIRRVGTKVLIDHPGFLSWIDGSGSYDGSVTQPENPPETCSVLPATAIKSSVTGSPVAPSAKSIAPQTQEIRPKSRSKEGRRRRT